MFHVKRKIEEKEHKKQKKLHVAAAEGPSVVASLETPEQDLRNQEETVEEPADPITLLTNEEAENTPVMKWIKDLLEL
mgnify:FL=1